jgi:CheY-like chemotaxis protein
MPRGGTITVATDVVADDDPDAPAWARIRVCDDGDGIAPEIIDRIFDPFFTTKPRVHGTGIGLAVAYGFVQQSGGSIDVKSDPGCGAEFTLLLPLVTPDTDAPPERAPTPARILVVDDEPAVRELTRRILEVQGFDAAVAGSRREALEILRTAESFDVVVTDVVMPGGSGPELAEAVRREFPGTRVIFMSGYTGDLADASMDGLQIVHKPFSAAELFRAVHGALTR